MQTINLKKYYYPLFVTDTFIEVSDEVAEALLLMRREENNRTHKIWYHKAYYSLDCEDGMSNQYSYRHGPGGGVFSVHLEYTKSPEEILVEREEEQVYLATLELLAEAMGNLTEIQARRIHARYILGKKLIEIAAEEGVSVSVVQQTVKSGLKRMRNYFEKKKWRE
jgi:RNA polymerase sigma-70 factor (ECF subfamily)